MLKPLELNDVRALEFVCWASVLLLYISFVAPRAVSYKAWSYAAVLPLIQTRPPSPSKSMPLFMDREPLESPVHKNVENTSST